MKRMVCFFLILAMICCASAFAEPAGDAASWVLGGFTLKLPSSYQTLYLEEQMRLMGINRRFIVQVNSLADSGWDLNELAGLDEQEKAERIMAQDEADYADAKRLLLNSGVCGMRYTVSEQSELHFFAGDEEMRVSIVEQDPDVGEAITADILAGLSHQAVSPREVVVNSIGGFSIAQPVGWTLTSQTGASQYYDTPTGSVSIQLVMLDDLGITQAIVDAQGYEETARTLFDPMLEKFQATEEISDPATFVTDNGVPGLMCWQRKEDDGEILTVYLTYGMDMLVASIDDGNRESALHCVEALEGAVSPDTMEGPVLVQQPNDQLNVPVGELVSFVVDARNVATWQWQYSTDGVTFSDLPESWPNSQTNQIVFQASEAHNNYLFRCAIADGMTGVELYSDAARLTVNTMGPGPVITQQPQNLSGVAVGDLVSFTVDGQDVAACQWQYSTDGVTFFDLPEAWPNSQTNQIAFQASEAHNGYFFRCVMSKANGAATYSAVAQLTLR